MDPVVSGSTLMRMCAGACPGSCMPWVRAYSSMPASGMAIMLMRAVDGAAISRCIMSCIARLELWGRVIGARMSMAVASADVTRTPCARAARANRCASPAGNVQTSAPMSGRRCRLTPEPA